MNRRIAIALVAALVVAALPSAASTFLARTPEELVGESAAVVTGTVQSIDSFWDETHTVIVSEIVMEVDSSVVGEAPRYVTLRIAGGTVEDFTVVAHGFPTFQEGERALVFLTPDAKIADRFQVAGYQQGHYRVITNRFGEDVAVPTVEGSSQFVSEQGKSREAPRAQPLDQLVERLRTAARQQKRFIQNQ